MASLWGAPDYPIIFTRHPVDALDIDQLRARAEEMMGQIVSALAGTER